jgi:magnesium transporter
MAEERDTRLLQIESMIRRLLRRKADVHLGNALEKVHPAEAAHIFRNLEPEERLQAFQVVANTEHRASILAESDVDIVREILEPMPDENIVSLLKEIEGDDVRYLLDTLSEERSGEVVKLLSADEPTSIEVLLAYDPETAGGIMTDAFVALSEEMSVEDAVTEVRKASEVDYVFYVYVVDEYKKLRGVISLRELMLSQPSQELSDIMTSNVWFVNVHADQEHVSRLVSRYNILAIPVVDDAGVLAGIVTVDDVIDVLRKEATEDMLKMAGTHAEEITDLTARRMAWVRFPWLFVSWLGGIVAASLIGLFEEDIRRVIALTAFMPVIIGMAGNVGTQSATIIVRGLATGRVNPNAWMRVVYKQLIAGLILGVAYGILLGILAVFQFRSVAYLGMVVGLSIAITMTLAGLLSSFLPLLLHRLRFDPAVATGPFVTTGVDIIGIFIYFSIARLLLA